MYRILEHHLPILEECLGVELTYMTWICCVCGRHATSVV